MPDDDSSIDEQLLSIFRRVDPTPSSIKRYARTIAKLGRELPLSEEADLLRQLGPDSVDLLLLAAESRALPIAQAVMRHPELVHPHTIARATLILTLNSDDGELP